MSEMRHMDAGEARALDAKDSKEVFGETMARLADCLLYTSPSPRDS